MASRVPGVDVEKLGHGALGAGSDGASRQPEPRRRQVERLLERSHLLEDELGSIAPAATAIQQLEGRREPFVQGRSVIEAIPASRPD